MFSDRRHTPGNRFYTISKAPDQQGSEPAPRAWEPPLHHQLVGEPVGRQRADEGSQAEREVQRHVVADAGPAARAHGLKYRSRAGRAVDGRDALLRAAAPGAVT